MPFLSTTQQHQSAEGRSIKGTSIIRYLHWPQLQRDAVPITLLSIHSHSLSTTRFFTILFDQPVFHVEGQTSKTLTLFYRPYALPDALVMDSCYGALEIVSVIISIIIITKQQRYDWWNIWTTIKMMLLILTLPVLLPCLQLLLWLLLLYYNYHCFRLLFNRKMFPKLLQCRHATPQKQTLGIVAAGLFPFQALLIICQVSRLYSTILQAAIMEQREYRQNPANQM